MKVIGLTGGIGTGKSTVAKILVAQGCRHVDADAIAHGLLRPRTELVGIIGERWPGTVQDGVLDRKALGRIVFASVEDRAMLESLVHPPLLAAVHRAFLDVSRDGVVWVLYDAPLLIETGDVKKCDAVIVVTATRETQVARIMARNGLSSKDAEARIDAQIPDVERRRHATYLIQNDGTLEELHTQTMMCWNTLTNRTN